MTSKRIGSMPVRVVAISSAVAWSTLAPSAWLLRIMRRWFACWSGVYGAPERRGNPAMACWRGRNGPDGEGEPWSGDGWVGPGSRSRWSVSGRAVRMCSGSRVARRSTRRRRSCGGRSTSASTTSTRPRSTATASCAWRPLAGRSARRLRAWLPSTTRAAKDGALLTAAEVETALDEEPRPARDRRRRRLPGPRPQGRRLRRGGRAAPAGPRAGARGRPDPRDRRDRVVRRRRPGPPVLLRVPSTTGCSTS